MSIRLSLTLLILIMLAFGSYHYQVRYLQQKQLAALAVEKTAAQQLLIQEQQTRLRTIAALDSRYAQELADAQHTIENLQRDVAYGTKRLQLAATCTRVPGSASATRVDYASATRLTDAAERDYFRLRNRIELASKQIAGLQDYIRQQCLNTHSLTEIADE